MKEFLLEIKESIKKIFYFLFHYKTEVKTLEKDNILMASDFIETGELPEAQRRLRTILTLWPNNNEAKYLLGFINMISKKFDDSLYYFNQLVNIDYKMSKKFIYFIQNDKVDILHDIYCKNFSLIMVEIFLEETKIY